MLDETVMNRTSVREFLKLNIINTVHLFPAPYLTIQQHSYVNYLKKWMCYLL